jgi:hypothetical protein
MQSGFPVFVLSGMRVGNHVMIILAVRHKFFKCPESLSVSVEHFRGRDFDSHSFHFSNRKIR